MNWAIFFPISDDYDNICVFSFASNSQPNYRKIDTVSSTLYGFAHHVIFLSGDKSKMHGSINSFFPTKNQYQSLLCYRLPVNCFPPQKLFFCDISLLQRWVLLVSSSSFFEKTIVVYSELVIGTCSFWVKVVFLVFHITASIRACALLKILLTLSLPELCAKLVDCFSFVYVFNFGRKFFRKKYIQFSVVFFFLCLKVPPRCRLFAGFG